MPKFIDLTGKQFGGLTVISKAIGKTSQGKIRWECRCQCGKSATVEAANLKNGHTQSCGCLHVERVRKSATIHGHSTCEFVSPEFMSWKAAKARCENPNTHGFHNYGGRGIKMCVEWLSDFSAFFAHIGPRPRGMSLDRFPNNDGDYEPGNVRWATPKQQRLNQRR